VKTRKTESDSNTFPFLYKNPQRQSFIFDIISYFIFRFFVIKFYQRGEGLVFLLFAAFLSISTDIVKKYASMFVIYLSIFPRQPEKSAGGLLPSALFLT